MNQIITIKNIDDIQDIVINNEEYIVIGVIGPEGPQGPRGPQGLQGEQGPAGQDGRDGTDGVDGFSPIANVSQSGSVTTISITDKEGTTTAEIDMSDYYTKDEVDESQQLQDNEINTINKIISQMPKVTGSGTSVTLNNTIEAPMRIELNPVELEQDSTTGKNKLNPNNVTSIQNTTINNGVVTQTQADTNTSIRFKVMRKMGTTTYDTANTITVTSTGRAEVSFVYDSSIMDNIVFGLNGSQRDTTVTSGTLNLVNGTTYYLSVNFTNITQGSVSWKDMMISTSQNDTYEPYTGGIASPNPSYPQTIHTISGDNEIKIENKNLFDKDNATVLYGYPSSSYIWQSRSGDSYEICVLQKLTAGKQYTVTRNILGQCAFRLCGSNTATLTNGQQLYNIASSENYTTKNITFTVPEGYEYVIFYLRNTTSISTLSVQDCLNALQIEYGSTASSYIEHKEQTYSITLGDIEYCKIGNYSDRIFKNIVGDVDYDNTRELGKWYIKKNIGKVVLDGSEPWQLYDSNVYFLDASIVSGQPTTGNIIGGYCSHTSVMNTTNMQYNSNQGTGLFVSNLVSYWGLNEATVSAWETWLSNHNVTLYYILKTPTYTILNNTLQEELEDIYSTIKSYSGQTNISQVNDDLSFNINASALLDLNSLIGG